ncbi:transcriptional regulator, TetR family [Denitrovibrio acetiphilus DSM 12809]|uniref:Transcriptional regulator, TetR family n=1 Tax=Denitrovibrio acetiphilus (strain DSM 12809 / NBRC 114555 / N2460) TaxID=522772 RepID=D4H0S9_DENA2|nr:TetR/AcrR family transcriptional regulator [Denitrovibrio acetiphilus]ADD68592.1 transcriptional regulator, TetR family [Denitrovibrio acetiphilus DSM 12809]
MKERCCKFSEKKKEAILESASELFLSKGYGDVSMDEIAKCACVSKRTVYNHFPSKELLFAEMVRLTWTSIEQPSLDIENSDDVREVLKAYTLNFLDIMRSEKFSNLLRLMMGESERFPELKKMYSEHGIRTVLSTVNEFFMSVNDAGILCIQDPMLTAQQYVGMVKESLFWPVLLGLFKQPTAERDELVVNSAIDIIFTTYSN